MKLVLRWRADSTALPLGGAIYYNNKGQSWRQMYSMLGGSSHDENFILPNQANEIMLRFGLYTSAFPLLQTDSFTSVIVVGICLQ